MNFDYKKLWECKWDNLFTSEYSIDNSIIIIVFDLEIEGTKYDKLQIKFLNIKDEWACYWNKINNKWENHSNKILPIGSRIEAFNVKKAGDSISISIGGNHILGFSRWGFYSENIEIKDLS
jgi:hypothetical protein